MKTLTIGDNLDVQYAVPLWVRDEQIRHAIHRCPGRVEPSHGLREEPIAVVCYGPSLADTWEEVRAFKHVITCSGAHRFLIERGVIPTWHVDVDPRAHKVALLGPPHADVVYLPASTVHPSYFDHLDSIPGVEVRLWHVFDNAEDAQRTLPPGEWSLTGGCSAGLRAMTVARFLGFRDQHIFGMDGNEREDLGKHAGVHPNQAPPRVAEVEYPEGSGRIWHTTSAFFKAAKQTFHELDQMPDVRATFHGEGLVQEMAKRYVSKPSAKDVVIAVQKPELISAAYRDLNRKLHESRLDYGVGGGKHADTVLKIKAATKAESILDYGCGRGYLAKALGFPIWEYDPAVSGKEESPRPADLVVCTDVLEHVEPEKVDLVLGDLRRVTRRVGYFVIHTGPSQKTLADGRNAHILQRPLGWWRNRLERFFQLGSIIEKGPLLHVVVGPTKPARASAPSREEAADERQEALAVGAA